MFFKPSLHLSTPIAYNHTTPSEYQTSLLNRHNASHIHHQERALNCRSPLLLRIRPPNGRGCYRLRSFKAYWNRWRVSRGSDANCIFTASILIETLVTPSPSARLLARSSTSAKKRRPSTYTQPHLLRCPPCHAQTEERSSTRF